MESSATSSDRRIRFEIEQPQDHNKVYVRKGLAKDRKNAISRRTGTEVVGWVRHRSYVPIWVKIWINPLQTTEWRRVVMRLDTGADFSFLPNPIPSGSPLHGLDGNDFGVTFSNAFHQREIESPVVEASFVVEGFPGQLLHSRFAIRPVLARKKTKKHKFQEDRFAMEGILSMSSIIRSFKIRVSSGLNEDFAIRLRYVGGAVSHGSQLKPPDAASGNVIDSKTGESGFPEEVYLSVRRSDLGPEGTKRGHNKTGTQLQGIQKEMPQSVRCHA